MATNEKLMTLLRLMDEPENVTEEQLRELLADEEVREAYELMADCKLLYQRDRRNKPTTLPVRFGQRWIFRIAAVFITAVFIGGLAWAISPLLSPKSEKKQSTEITAPPPTSESGRRVHYLHRHPFGLHALHRWKALRQESCFQKT
jgi:hypothetical protein